MNPPSTYRGRGLGLGLAGALLLGSCTKSAPILAQFSAADDASVRAVLHDQRDAWNRGDIEGFLAGYERSDDLIFTSGATVRRGFEETRTKFRAKYGDEPESMGTLAFDLLDVRGVGADGAAVLGRWALTETPQAGSGIFSVILERQQGTWRVIHDHTSASEQQGGGEHDRGVGRQPRPKEPMKAQEVGVETVEEDTGGHEQEREVR